jgi:alkylation response protein AidB-like acyl-CoA dehydrogenase
LAALLDGKLTSRFGRTPRANLNGLNYTPEEEKFRKELRGWLAKARPRGRSRLAVERGRAGVDEDEAWRRLVALHAKLHRGGWIGLSGPKEYGGRGAAVMESRSSSTTISRDGSSRPAAPFSA